MKTQTVEWLYTLPKSIICKAFDQPEEAEFRRRMDCHYRSDCVDAYLLWDKTKEGRRFWEKINNRLSHE